MLLEKNITGVTVPKVFDDLCTRRILVSEWMDGKKVREKTAVIQWSSSLFYAIITTRFGNLTPIYIFPFVLSCRTLVQNKLPKLHQLPKRPS